MQTLGGINVKLERIEQSGLAFRMERAEADIKRIDKYSQELKHLIVDPYVRATDVLKQRVDGLDRVNR